MPTCVGLVCGWLLLVGAQPASAQITNTGSFGSAGTGDGQFSSPQGVAVDQATGDVYVVDTGNYRVEKFDSSGSFIAAWGWGVSDGSAKSEVCTSSCQAGLQGMGAGQFNDPLSIAVDNDPSSPSYQDVYVADEGNNVIEKFDSSGNYLSSITGPNGGSFSTVTNAATDTSGDVWAYDVGANVDEFDASGNTIQSWNTGYGASPGFTVDANDNVYALRGFPATEKFTSAGKDLGELDPSNENGSALGADLVSDRVFDAQHSFVNIYSGTATPPTSPVASFGQGILSDATGVADNESSGVVYVSDSSNDDVQMFQVPSGPPSVDSEAVANVTSTDASLKAQINPNFSDTTYQFQYGKTTSYGKKAPATPQDIGSGVTDVSASAPLTGLAPNTTYHFRVVAKSAKGTTDGPDHTLKTYPSKLASGLPDGRAYEQVTPANKDQGDPYVRAAPGFYIQDQAAASGNAFSFFSLYAFPGSKFDGNSYLAQRGKRTWVTQNLIPPQSTEGGFLCSAEPEIAGYSSDFSMAVLADGGGQPSCGHDDPRLVKGEPHGVQNLFLRNNKTGAYRLISLNPVSGPPADATFDGASADLGHVAFDESAQLTSDAPSGDDLYDWSSGKVSLVTEVPSSGTSCTGASCTAVVGALAGGELGNALHAVSADGSRIFFTANGNLYARINETSTQQVDAPASGAPGPGGGGQFVAASADGSKVFFTDDSSAGLTSNTQSGSGTNLYEYNVSSGTLTDLTPSSDAQVQGVSAVSSDGSYLYFVANGVLAGGATSGQPNLYLFHKGKTGFIATLNSSDDCDWGLPSAQYCLSARASSSGRYLAFNSVASLTGYDNTDANTGSPDPEIFLYDARQNKLVCASCNPSGAAPTGGATIYGAQEFDALSSTAHYLQRYVSDSGQVFFDTPDALVPKDTNGLRDVYEYERDGTGSCKSSAENGGCLSLLSSGRGAADSFYLDSTPDGSNAFFATADQLVPFDTDGTYDIYDARADGGFPAPKPPPPPCSGEGCKPPPKSPPPLPTIGTITFHGPGNVSAKAIKHAVRGTSFKVAVTVPRRGEITIGGAGVRTVQESAARAGTYTLRVTLTARERRLLKVLHRLKLKLRVRYMPASGRAATATIKLTVKA